MLIISNFDCPAAHDLYYLWLIFESQQILTIKKQKGTS